MTYEIPADDRPQYVTWTGPDWESATPGERWWLPAVVVHGGRDADVVIDSRGEMSIFHGKDRAGTAAAPYSPHAPHGEEFWPLSEKLPDPAAASHQLSDTGWMVAQVDGEYGLAMSVQVDTVEAMRWRMALAFTLLGFYPPLGAEFEGTAAEFRTGVDTVGERSARRVKRALIERLQHDRRVLRGLSDKIEANWRP